MKPFCPNMALGKYMYLFLTPLNSLMMIINLDPLTFSEILHGASLHKTSMSFICWFLNRQWNFISVHSLSVLVNTFLTLRNCGVKWIEGFKPEDAPTQSNNTIKTSVFLDSFIHAPYLIHITEEGYFELTMIVSLLPYFSIFRKDLSFYFITM